MPQATCSAAPGADAAKEYLTQFSDRAWQTLQGYEIDAIDYLNFIPQKPIATPTKSEYKLQLLNNLSHDLENIVSAKDANQPNQ